jgi:hypothetical protein
VVPREVAANKAHNSIAQQSVSHACETTPMSGEIDEHLMEMNVLYCVITLLFLKMMREKKGGDHVPELCDQPYAHYHARRAPAPSSEKTFHATISE